MFSSEEFELCDLCDNLRQIITQKLQEQTKIQDEEEKPPPFSPPAKRRSPNTSLVDLINGFKIEKECRKKPSEIKDSGTLRHRVDCALAYLIRLCGFKDFKS